MNISSMLSADSNNAASDKQITTAHQLENQPPTSVSASASSSGSPPLVTDLHNDEGAEKFTTQPTSTHSLSAQSPTSQLTTANISSHQPEVLSPLKHANGAASGLPSSTPLSDSIVAGILPTSYELTSSEFTPAIDQKYKAAFENNINVINKLDHYQQISHNLKLLKFDEAKLNNYLISTGQFASNYIDRVVAEDISSRNNKISDTNKNKELVYIDYSKPLHHNSTRGKEYKWGSTREIHKVDHKTRRRRPAASDDASKNASATNGTKDQADGTIVLNNGSAHPADQAHHHDRKLTPSKQNTQLQKQQPALLLQQQPILIKPKGGGVQGQFEVQPRRSSRAKVKRKAFEDEAEEVEQDPEVARVEETPENVTGGDLKRAKVEEDGKAKAVLSPAAAAGMTAKEYKAFMRQYDNTYIAIWKDMSRKDGPKVSRLMQQSTQARLINLRKTCILAAREAKRWQLRNTKNQKDLTTKARRAMREMFNFWKRNERIERDLKKKHEKELLDKAKKEEEEREAKRQARKLNFLITQTELYSHFIGKKIKTDEIEGSDADGKFKPVDKKHLDKYADVDGSASHDINSLDFDNDDEDALHRMAAENAQNALVNAQNKARQFDNDEPFKNPDTNGEEMNFQNPTLLGDITVPQPNMLKCTLKEYQLKGLNWLANLYEQGINGILADEMGLGKTVQSISVLSYLAETHNIWGPFLVVTPASTLHNWQQEITKFVPEFKVLPYWGNAKDRKVLRKFWDRKSVRYDKDAPFHVLVTSYQLIVADIAYFQKMKWQYMILDEAQAIKSSSSSRWKSLLSLSCRNRLLLTGTPIQNSMQELWALLHFIMPTLFDSHDEFSDWFSKDIESHAQSNTSLDEQQLRRLHMILKPFMLRRIKKNVQSELGDKVEVDIFCDLTTRQKKLYQQLRSLISILDSDLLDSATAGTDSSLANLVMQFRKVCNHPDLFERADVKSPFSFGKFAETGSFLRESNELEMAYSTENIVDYQLPRLIYDELLTPNYENNTLDAVYEKFSIYNPENTEHLGWLKSIDVSQGELKKLSQQDLLSRAVALQSYGKESDSSVGRLNYIYEGEFVPKNKKLLITEYNNQPRSNSEVLSGLYSVVDQVAKDMYMNRLEPAATPLASAPPITVNCSSLNFANKFTSTLFDSSIRSSLAPLPLSTEAELMKHEVPLDLYPKSNLLPVPTFDYSNIRMPSMERFIAECGKLARLDELLVELKKNGHRILIYFQMTRMMEIFQEYLAFRNYKFMRLDGSTTIEARRELVTQWQTNPDFFIFMLSTRAGGLGLNLTSADTVIFYDSDWNPTVDAQAMDRAHRIGQTKVVTVYRLLTRNTIEERIRQKAQNKEEIQKLVINQ
ncbi:putative DNA helicase INO80 [Candida viswanathii]|uniref:Chromatin-remodeling ATPase INO80 n=1 Tax=Candida viswanathii TaxID=5486 RepID=A0A367YAS7_9ASCO|nr:putative DNA helicase INO80 [Candida viswanathii]